MMVFALTTVLAAAGGGSSGFGGGGGGGGGSYGGGGAGGAGGGSPLFFLVIVVAFLAFVLFSGLQVRKVRKRREARRRQVELASAEAADDDPLLAADMVVQAAERIFRAAQAAWDARDDARLAKLLDADLLVEWRRRLDDFAERGWDNRVEVLSVDAVEYLGLVNREGTANDRVTVRISARLRDWVETLDGATVMRKGAASSIISLTEYWTLGRRDGRLDRRLDRVRRRGRPSSACATPRSSRSRPPTSCRTAFRRRRSPTSTTPATRAPLRSTCRSPTAAGHRTCSRRQRGARSPPGQRRWTVPTATCSTSRHQTRRVRCCTPAIRRARRGS